MTEFRTRIEPNEVSIYNLHKHLPKLDELTDGYEVEASGPFTVTWQFELETRDWGVKEMSWFITNVEGQFEIVYFDGAGNEKDREMVDFEFAPFERKTEMDIDIDHRSVAIDSLEIDYFDMSVRAT